MQPNLTKVLIFTLSTWYISDNRMNYSQEQQFCCSVEFFRSITTYFKKVSKTELDYSPHVQTPIVQHFGQKPVISKSRKAFIIEYIKRTVWFDLEIHSK